MTILYADDDADDRALLLEALNQIDPSISCDTVCDGRQALDRLNELPELPDYIFLDVNMPVMGGKECLAAIKTNERLRYLPVVIYSTSSDQGEISRLYEMGAMLFLQKPDSLASLHENLSLFLMLATLRNA